MARHAAGRFAPFSICWIGWTESQESIFFARSKICATVVLDWLGIFTSTNSYTKRLPNTSKNLTLIKKCSERKSTCEYRSAVKSHCKLRTYEVAFLKKLWLLWCGRFKIGICGRKTLKHRARIMQSGLLREIP